MLFDSNYGGVQSDLHDYVPHGIPSIVRHSTPTEATTVAGPLHISSNSVPAESMGANDELGQRGGMPFRGRFALSPGTKLIRLRGGGFS